MKKLFTEKNFWDIGIGLVITAGVGMFIDFLTKRIPSTEFWILLVSLIIGVVSMLISHYWLQLTTFLRRINSRYILTKEVLTRKSEAWQLLNLKDEQAKNYIKWLYPVMEYIDLNRQGSAHNDNDVYIKFQVDSHLLFPVNEFYIFVKLCLAVPSTNKENDSEWYEIKKPENYAPIGRLGRYIFSNKIHLEGKTDKEKVLLTWMRDFRKGTPILAMLKIGLTFKQDDNPIILEGGGARYIAPMNDYRME